MIIKSRLEIILILFIFSLASGLSTYFNYNGYIRDDWGMFETYGTNGSLFNQFKSIATSLLANRPGLAAVNVSFINLIGDNPIFFYIINLIIYTVGIFFLNLFLKKILNTNTEILISLLFFPIISSTTLFSPLNLLGANVSFLLYAIGSYLLIRNIEKKKISYSIIITILFSVSLLTYEISGPLIIYTYFLIFFFLEEKFDFKKYIKSNYIIFIPLIFSLGIYFFHQKILCGILDGNNCLVSRFKLISILLKPEMIAKTTISYLTLVFVNFPIFLFSSITYAILEFDIISWLLIILATYFLIKNKNFFNFPKINIIKFKSFLTISLVISSSIFIISGTEYPTFYGYENRGAMPCWIILSIMFVLIFAKYIKIQKFYYLFLLLIIFNFVAQSQEIRQNYNLQSRIIKSIKNFDKNYKNKIFFVILPTHNIKFNFSNHEVFRYDWDFPRAVRLRSTHSIQNRYYLLNKYNFDEIKISKNKIILDGYLKINVENSDIIKYIPDKNEFKTILKIKNNFLEFVESNFLQNEIFNYSKITNNALEIEPNSLGRKLKNFIKKYIKV